VYLASAGGGTAGASPANREDRAEPIEPAVGQGFGATVQLRTIDEFASQP
jgi:hypothetical protein